jgi:PAS domain S-box-containing protein
MNLRARIILAALIVIALVNVTSVVYFVDREHKAAVMRLHDTIAEDARLLQVVTAGPLYDGNVAQLGATIDSIFANPDILEMALKETRGDIAIARKREAVSQSGELIQREIPVIRGRDELGRVRVAYTTANIEKRLQESRNVVVLFSLAMMGVIVVLIFPLAARLTQPIERLTRAAHAMAEGDLEREIEVRPGRGELAVLGQSFVHMRNAVRQKMDDLEKTNLLLAAEVRERVRAEEDMHVKDNAIETSVNAVAIADVGGKIFYVNPAFIRMWGYAYEREIIGKTPADFTMEPSEAHVIVSTMLEHGFFVGEMAGKRKDGTTFPAEISASIVKDRNGAVTHMMASFVDITERKALEMERARLASIVKSSAEAIISRSLDGSVLTWNAAAEQMFGYAASEVVGKNIDFIIPADRQQEVAQKRDQLAHGVMGSSYDTVRLCKGGKLIDVSATQSPIRDANGRVIAVSLTFRDIAERKRAEEALRQSEKRFRALVELSSDWYWETDENHRFTFREGEVLRRMGIPPEADYGKTRWEIGFTNKSEADWEAHRAALDRREEFRDLLLERRSADGRVHWAMISGKPLYDGAGKFIGYHGTGRDVTAQVAAERALRESEARISEAYETLNDTLENAPAAIALYDAEDKLIAWNSGYRDTFFSFNPGLVQRGIDFRTMLWEFYASGQVLTPKREGKEWIEERIRQHRSPSGVGELEITGGRWFQVRETLSATGRVASVYADITALKERELALRHLTEELENKVAERTADLAEANKELEAFAYSVSHDLRAPLRGIDGFSHLLVEEYSEKLDPEARRLLERIRAGAQRMGHLITELLELSRMARVAVHSAEVDLSALAQAVVDELKAEAAGREVEWRIEPGMKVRADPGLLRIALVNLLGNALKYTRNAAMARVEIGVSRRAGNLVEIFVRDNGAGFDMAYAERLFKPFQRLHAAHEFEGTGIGLATVQRVIARHGGDVRAEGTPGDGATFYFTLPT